MTEKRFYIIPSVLVDDVTVIIDNGKQYTFPVLDSTLNFMFCKALNELSDENKQLKQQIKKLESQLYCPYDSICIKCKNEYLVRKGEQYVSKCKKGHKQCSITDVLYCVDFELKGDD